MGIRLNGVFLRLILELSCWYCRLIRSSCLSEERRDMPETIQPSPQFPKGKLRRIHVWESTFIDDIVTGMNVFLYVYMPLYHRAMSRYIRLAVSRLNSRWTYLGHNFRSIEVLTMYSRQSINASWPYAVMSFHTSIGTTNEIQSLLYK